MKMEGFEKRVLSSRAWRLVTQRIVVPLVTGVAGLPTRAEALQLGCGGGFETVALARRFPDWTITATDYDADMVDLAKGRLAPIERSVRVEQADATALQYPDRSFDVVIAIGVWHHVGDWQSATAEAARALRAGGVLVLADLLDPFFRRPLARLFPPLAGYRFDELEPVLKEVGFARYRARAGRLWYRLVAIKGDALADPQC